MRNTSQPVDSGQDGVAPIPLICGSKKRADTCESTMNAESPWKFGMVPRTAKPGIFELAHSIGKVIGESPSTLKSYALCVYFQMYSPSSTKYFPKACESPAWNSLRQPGLSGVVLTHGVIVDAMMAAITWSLHPRLERTRFSLNGVSSVRA